MLSRKLAAGVGTSKADDQAGDRCAIGITPPCRFGAEIGIEELCKAGTEFAADCRLGRHGELGAGAGAAAGSSHLLRSVHAAVDLCGPAYPGPSYGLREIALIMNRVPIPISGQL